MGRRHIEEMAEAISGDEKKQGAQDPGEVRSTSKSRRAIDTRPDFQPGKIGGGFALRCGPQRRIQRNGKRSHQGTIHQDDNQ